MNVTSAVSVDPDRRRYRSFDYAEAGRSVRLTLPEGLPVVRGLLVVGPGAGDDSRERHAEPWYREFLHLHDFAYVGTRGFTSHAENVPILLNALRRFAADAQRPELVHAPFAATGFSAGSGFASRMLVELPERVLAAAIVGARLNLTGVTPTAAHFATPACIINGERENDGLAPLVAPVLAACRPQGALWSWMAVPGGFHLRNGQEVLSVPFLDAAVRLRYPTDGDVRKGPLKLKRLDPRAGWIADNASWRSGLTRIVPARDFHGDIARSSWLPNEDIAWIYRAYSTFGRTLQIFSVGATPGQVRDAGGNVTFRVYAPPAGGWATLALYDGAKKVGESSGKDAEFRVDGLTPGYHAFSVLGADRSGNVRPSNPTLVVVRG